MPWSIIMIPAIAALVLGIVKGMREIEDVHKERTQSNEVDE